MTSSRTKSPISMPPRAAAAGARPVSGSLVLLHLAGAVALLLFATRQVRTGVERAYGDVLRLRLRSILQATRCWPSAPALCWPSACRAPPRSRSSSARSSGRASSAALSGLLAVLGADVGSSLVVKLLSFDLEILTPICLVAGTRCSWRPSRRDLLQLGRILIGIGLLILSLRLIGEASEPLRESRILPVIVNYLVGRPGHRLPDRGDHDVAFPLFRRGHPACRGARRPRPGSRRTRRRAGARRQYRRRHHRGHAVARRARPRRASCRSAT